ncbi:tail fiber domain-containing protein [Bacillus cereus]|uniref:tail fiber domain-containing protein n=1 Tax=Bacillus cereus TaxID=1396 RepID=UPI00283D5175|nr:tail fiber domain-containing protein [Bacillus cereus]MDR4442205.1 tail fiber domain-containing protein [Bacillus cereus]
MANLYGTSNDPNVAAVFGDSTGGPAVWGNHKLNHPNASGVYGTSQYGVGVWGKGGRLAGMFEGDVQIANGRVWANNTVNHPNASAVLGTSQYGVGVWGKGGRLAGMFEGDVDVSGTIKTRKILVDSQRLGFPCVEIWQDGLGDILAALHQGRTVFSISNNGSFFTNGGGDIRDNLFVGGYLTVTGDIAGKGVKLTSDKNAKENFSHVNILEILDNLATLPIQSWNYKDTPSSERHIGPTAQDFHATFGLNGDDNMRISSVDLQGVALAAIQGLNEKLKAENAELHAKLDNLEARLSVLEYKG